MAKESPVESGSFVRVPVGALTVDPEYQRDKRSSQVKRMAENFDFALAGALEVSERKDGSLVILDGQHRAEALTIAEGPKALITIHRVKGLSLREEAHRFNELNKKRAPLTAYDSFKARLVAGDETVVAIDRVIRAHGMIPSQGQRRANAKQFSAITGSERIVRVNGIDRLDMILDVVRESWPDDSYGVSAEILEGMSRFFSKHERDDKFSIKELKRSMKNTTPREVAAKGRAASAVMGFSNPGSTAYLGIIGAYNHKRKARRLDIAL